MNDNGTLSALARKRLDLAEKLYKEYSPEEIILSGGRANPNVDVTEADAMLKELNVKYTIIGHSERRQYWNDNDIIVNRKAHAAIDAGLYPIICVGESKEQRELGVTKEVIDLQVKTALSGIPAEKIRHVVIAYEPLWAIGTGDTATAEQANEVCEEIRTVIRKLYGARVARSVTILYGGSMNENNAHDLLAQPDVDGGLIGGASLVPKKFTEIINAANQE